jgi:dynein heavy chain
VLGFVQHGDQDATCFSFGTISRVRGCGPSLEDAVRYNHMIIRPDHQNRNYVRDANLLVGAVVKKHFKWAKYILLETMVGSYADYIEKQLPPATPTAFGLHPNAEIGFLSNFTEDIFATIIALDGGGGEGDGEGGGGGVGSVMEDLLARLPNEFETLTLNHRAKPLLAGEQSPYVVVALQEVGYANTLLGEMKRTLIELQKGLNGQLSMSEPMEHLAQALKINQVPGRNPYHSCSWEKFAWWSKKALASWFNELINRNGHLNEWASELALPYSIWLPGLFSPAAFLTAVKQVTARREGLPLDKMTVSTHCTTMMNPEDADSYQDDGALVHGLFIEGARWAGYDEPEVKQEEPVVVGATSTAGWLVDSRLKELMPAMPVIYIQAVQVEPHWEPSAVGFLRHQADVYDCPVFMTTMRGPTYIFLATLTTKVAVAKWTLLGAALMLQQDD